MRFPDCPNCGLDELASDVLDDWAINGFQKNRPRPWEGEVLAGRFWCYVCSWRGTLDGTTHQPGIGGGPVGEGVGKDAAPA